MYALVFPKFHSVEGRDFIPLRDCTWRKSVGYSHSFIRH